MNRLELFKQLRRHRKWAEQRALNYEQNKTAKYMVWVGSSLAIVYFLFLAIMFSLIVNNLETITPLECFFGAAPYLLFIDFWIRYLGQQAPAQIIKPYLLLPIPKYACIESFLVTSMLSTANLLWYCVMVPFALMSIVFVYGIWITLYFLLLWWLLVVLNSQWLLICKVMITNNVLWWALPVVFYAAIMFPVLLDLGGDAGWEACFDMHAKIGAMIEKGNPLPMLVTIALIGVTFFINRYVQYTHIWKELGKVKTTRIKHVSRMAFLDRFGDLGLYIKLEIKTIMRNKNPRKSFVMAMLVVILFSALISFTEVYDGAGYANFWCLYNYVLFSSYSLLRIMGNEGNYIDGLMVRKENLLGIFHAKYVFYSLMLAWPFLLMLPTVFAGKWSLFMLISFATFTAGFQHFLFFQMAVYNKQTMPLNTKFISKGNIENNYMQVVTQFAVFGLPMTIVTPLRLFFGESVAYLGMFLIGLAFVLTSRWWLRNVYNRLMKRRYANMESFRASRA